MKVITAIVTMIRRLGQRIGSRGLCGLGATKRERLVHTSVSKTDMTFRLEKTRLNSELQD